MKKISQNGKNNKLAEENYLEGKKNLAHVISILTFNKLLEYFEPMG
jgi:hypothetical protein